MPKTIPTETPDMPEWVKRSPACSRAWKRDLSWRCDAAKATTRQRRKFLEIQAKRVYG